MKYMQLFFLLLNIGCFTTIYGMKKNATTVSLNDFDDLQQKLDKIYVTVHELEYQSNNNQEQVQKDATIELKKKLKQAERENWMLKFTYFDQHMEIRELQKLNYEMQSIIFSLLHHQNIRIDESFSGN
jgi:hypothetical protein